MTRARSCCLQARAHILERGAVTLIFFNRLFPRRQFLIHCWRSSLVGCTASLVAITPQAGSAEESLGALLDRSFVWEPDQGTSHNRFVAFRHHIKVPRRSLETFLHIFADTRYVAYLNGSRLASGPARFDFRYPEYDSLPLGAHLRPGHNVLAVLVQSLGATNAWSTVHAPGSLLCPRMATGERRRPPGSQQ